MVNYISLFGQNSRLKLKIFIMSLWLFGKDNCLVLVWFAGAFPSWKCQIYTLWLRCAIGSSEVPKPFERGTRATELESSGALVERPLERVLPSLGCIHHVISKKEHMVLCKEHTSFLQTSIPRFGGQSIFSLLLSHVHLSFFLIISKLPTKQYFFAPRVKMYHFGS